MTAEVWPQPETEERPWHDRVLYLHTEHRNANVRVREVQLWGKTVLINEQHDVFCDCCRRFVPVQILGRIDNPHRAGLPYRAAGQLLPMDRDDESGHRAEEGF
jgi:hypothetical protein